MYLSTLSNGFSIAPYFWKMYNVYKAFLGTLKKLGLTE